MRVVEIVVEIDAAPAQVWRALTVPAEVVVWAGVATSGVPADYPVVGQHARWTFRRWGLPFVLHDRIVTVEPTRRFGARVDVGICRLDEEYRLEDLGGGRTLLTSHNRVRGRLPCLGALAARRTRRDVAAAMAALAVHCAAGSG